MGVKCIQDYLSRVHVVLEASKNHSASDRWGNVYTSSVTTHRVALYRYRSATTLLGFFDNGVFGRGQTPLAINTAREYVIVDTYILPQLALSVLYIFNPNGIIRVSPKEVLLCTPLTN